MLTTPVLEYSSTTNHGPMPEPPCFQEGQLKPDLRTLKSVYDLVCLSKPSFGGVFNSLLILL